MAATIPPGSDEQFERLWFMLVDANPFRPDFTACNVVGDRTTAVDLGEAFDDLVGLVATRNSDLDGKLVSCARRIVRRPRV